MNNLDLADRIYALRKQQGWTQMDLAIKVGTAPNRVNDWEKGRHMATVESLQKIADAFGITVSKLLDGVM